MAHSKCEVVLSRMVGISAALLIAAQLFFILKDASWTLVSDDFDFLTHFVSGIPFLPIENLSMGRFTPLAFLEYNLLIPFGDNPTAYYVWVSFKYIITLVFFFLIQREILDRTGLSRLSKGFKLIFTSISTIIFLLLPGLFVVFLDVVYYENTSIPISLIFIYTLISVFKRTSFLKMLFLMFLFNAMLYLKETYVVFFLPSVLMGLILKSSKTHPAARKLIISALFSIGLYLVFYYFLVYQQTDVFYHEGRNLSFFKGGFWLIMLNPALLVALTCISIMAALNKTNFAITRFVALSTLSVCGFFLAAGMYAASYRMSIVYPFLFFVTQIEVIMLFKHKRSVSTFVPPLLLVLTLYCGFISLGTSMPHLMGRGHHFSMLRLINRWSLNQNSLTYIYKGDYWHFSKHQLDVSLIFIATGQASQQSAQSIVEIDSLSEIAQDRDAILFFPDNQMQNLGVFESHQVDTVIKIDGFGYDAIALKRN